MVALSAVLIIVAAVLFDLFASKVASNVRKKRREKRRALAKSGEQKLADSPLDTKIARGVFHSRGHMWCYLNADGTALIGMNDLLHKIIGKIDRFSLPETGRTVRRGEKIILIKQGDRVLYLQSPLSGTIIESNKTVSSSPANAKNDPYGEGWLIKIEPSDAQYDISYLLIMRRAEDWIRRETDRMKAFFTDLIHKGIRIDDSAGDISMEGIMEKLDETTWVIFKDQFIYQHEWRS